MSFSKPKLEDLLRLRDELKVQAHLLKAEAKDQLDELEKKLEGMNIKVHKTLDATIEASGDISAAKDVLLDEIIKGYKKVKSSIK